VTVLSLTYYRQLNQIVAYVRNRLCRYNVSKIPWQMLLANAVEQSTVDMQSTWMFVEQRFAKIEHGCEGGLDIDEYFALFLTSLTVTVIEPWHFMWLIFEALLKPQVIHKLHTIDRFGIEDIFSQLCISERMRLILISCRKHNFCSAVVSGTLWSAKVTDVVLLSSHGNFKKSDRHRREKKSNVLPALQPLKDYDKHQVVKCVSPGHARALL